MLCDGPAPDHGDDGAGGEHARAPRGAPAEQDEHRDAADDREDHERQSVALQPVEDVRASAWRATRPTAASAPVTTRRDQRAAVEVRSRSGVPARRASLTRKTLAR